MDKKIKIDNLVGLYGYGNHDFHPYFGDDEYINVTLFDKYGNINNWNYYIITLYLCIIFVCK